MDHDAQGKHVRCFEKEIESGELKLSSTYGKVLSLPVPVCSCKRYGAQLLSEKESKIERVATYVIYLRYPPSEMLTRDRRSQV